MLIKITRISKHCHDCNFICLNLINYFKKSLRREHQTHMERPISESCVTISDYRLTKVSYEISCFWFHVGFYVACLVCAKIFHVLDFFFNFYCSQIMNYLCQKCKKFREMQKNLGVTSFQGIQRVESYPDFEIKFGACRSVWSTGVYS